MLELHLLHIKNKLNKIVIPQLELFADNSDFTGAINYLTNQWGVGDKIMQRMQGTPKFEKMDLKNAWERGPALEIMARQSLSRGVIHATRQHVKETRRLQQA